MYCPMWSWKQEALNGFIVHKKQVGGKSSTSFAHQKEIFLVLTAIIIVVVAFPLVQQTLMNKKSEPNSELWLLGQQHTADNYPSSVTPYQNNTVFLDVKNNMGKSVQYIVQVKFLNKTQLGVASSAPSLYNITGVVENGGTWDLPIVFSIDYYRTASQINLNSINFNGAVVDAAGSSVAWDSEREGFFGYLYFELWTYNSSAGSFQNDGRSVDLRLALNT